MKTHSRRPARAVLARFALRDLRAGVAGLRILLLCVALGVAAIVAVNSLGRSLADGLARDGRTIVGGDASFSLIHRELAPEERAFLAAHGDLSTIATLRAMARSEAGDATLVEVKAVEAAWPRLGEAEFAPAMTPAAALARHGEVYGVAVEQALLDRLGLKIGDTFTIGATRFEIRTVLVAEPDRLAAGIGLGPRALISQDALRASGLIQPGALIRWTTRVILDPGRPPPSDAAVDALLNQAKAAFPEAGWEARTRANVSPDFSRDLDRFSEYLALVGLISLVVGGVGVANAAH
ncbi:MAG: ABC transporter permease, partial [Hyphomicrobiales bacterium]|nr:ABC transporter permease [Hyphomicrobiales bacterium]